MAKKSKRKFHKTVYQFTVLSEHPIPEGVSLEDVLNETENGDYVGYMSGNTSEEINSTQVVSELKKASSEAEFFQLNNKGEDIED